MRTGHGRSCAEEIIPSATADEAPIGGVRREEEELPVRKSPKKCPEWLCWAARRDGSQRA